MAAVIEQLSMLRALGVHGDEKQLQVLLRTAGYDVQRAINHYFDAGLPEITSSKPKSAMTAKESAAMPTPSTLTEHGPSKHTAATDVTGHARVPLAKAPPPSGSVNGGPPCLLEGSMEQQSGSAPPGSTREDSWPKFIGERWVTGYSIRRGSIAYEEEVAIISEGSASAPGRDKGIAGGSKKGKGSRSQSKRGRGGVAGAIGKQGGRHLRAASAGSMAHILFRGARGGVEGRLPGEVCIFLAPLLQRGLVRARAKAVCGLPGLGVFAEVPLVLSMEIEQDIFALDSVADEELYKSAYALLQFAHTGHIEQEQLRAQLPVAKDEARTSDNQISNTYEEGEGQDAAEVDAANRGDRGQEEVQDEHVRQLYDDEAQLCGMPEAPDPSLFADGIRLRRYQKQALAWMLEREKRRYVTEEDCTGLSLGGASSPDVKAPSASPSAQEGSGNEGENADSISLRDGRVHVSCWARDAARGDSGGGLVVAMHPLWDRRAAASLTQAKASKHCLPSEIDGARDGDAAAGAGSTGCEAGHALSNPEAFYVNVYTRRFQREFPRASLGCRGGILADEMGMGKTVMLLSLILSDKDRIPDTGANELVALVEGAEISSVTAPASMGTSGVQPGEERDATPCDNGREGGIGDDRGHSNIVELEEDLASAAPQDGTRDGTRCDYTKGDVAEQPRKRPPSEVDDPASVPAKRRRPRGAESGDQDGAARAGGDNVEDGVGGGDSAAKNSRSTRRAENEKPMDESNSILLVDDSSENDGKGVSNDSGNGISDSDFEPASGLREVGDDDDDSSNEDKSDEDDSDSDFEPGGEGQPTATWRRRKRGAQVKQTRRGDRNRFPACSSGRQAKKGTGRDGREGGVTDTSEASAIRPEPYTAQDDAVVTNAAQERIVEDVSSISTTVTTVTTKSVNRSSRGRVRGRSEMTGGTLVVCPLSLIGQWRAEMETKTRKGALAVCFHYGAGRSRSTRHLCRYDVVLTTYGVLSSEMVRHEADLQAGAGSMVQAVGSPGGKRRPSTGLLGLHWQRIILDEAHSIRNTSTEQSRASLLLEADQRWAVTGTPIQNSLDDVAALLAFLRHEPWSDRGWWKKVIADPYKDGDMEALRRLKTALAPVMLRRTKTTLDSRGRPIVELPPKNVQIIRLQLSPVEREFYEALKQRSKIEFEGYVAAGTVMKSYIAILTLLLRLRQACNHPFLVLGKGPSAAVIEGRKPAAKSSGSACPSTGPHGVGASTISATATSMDSGGLMAEPGDQAAGTTPSYVEELYRHYRQRVAAAAAAEAADDAVASTSTSASSSLRAGNESRGGGSCGGGSRAFVDSVVGQLQEEDGQGTSSECPVCLDQPMDAPALTPCAHLLCRACLEDCLRREACCPVCRLAMRRADIIDVTDSQSHAPDAREEHEEVVEHATVARTTATTKKSTTGHVVVASRPGPEGWIGSTKLETLERELRSMKRTRSSAKAVVFSQWTHMLDLAEQSLARGGWTFRRLDGAMTQQKREAALKAFSTDEKVTVMLVSLKAGGVGLNLTAASTVFLLDPWWNPAVEDQAIDRIHRLGQVNDVSVKRFIVEDTVEEKMLALQEVKGNMAKNALASGSIGEAQKLRVEDLMQFFK